MFADVNAITVPEFMEWAELVEGRYELVAGHIVPHPDYLPTVQGFAAADNEHNAIVSNIVQIVGRQLERPCRMYASAGIEIATNTANIADAAMSCLDDLGAKNLRSPAFVFEVSSQRTYRNDTGRKVTEYTSLASLAAYVFVDCKNRAITVYRPDQPPQSYSSGTIALSSAIVLPFADVFSA